MWLADEPQERGRGLMGVTDLGEAEAMVFVFDKPISGGGFYMFQTVTPLSIGWFAPDGPFVSSTDMNPCVGADSSRCERFYADGTYQFAVEVFQGDLAKLGIGDGSRIEVLSDRQSEHCPLAS